MMKSSRISFRGMGLAAVISVVGISSLELNARSWRPSLIPNGSVISCSACHFNPNGGGSRTSFGQAVNGLVGRGSRAEFWSASLAALDSDGDGFSNGTELGDPDGDGVADSGVTPTNPGDANDKPEVVEPEPEPGDGSIPATVVSDTTLWSTDVDNNLGAGADFAAGRTDRFGPARGLIKFELPSEIPAGARINVAKVGLTVVRTPPAAVSSIFELRRVLVEWFEGEKTGRRGEVATAGETTWNHISVPDVAWSTPGGAIGIEFSSVSSASVEVNGDGSYVFESTPQLAADVQSWFRNPATNFGWVLVSQGEESPGTVRRFSSREAASGEPTLGVTFEEGPFDDEPGTLSISSSDGGIQVEWDFGVLQSSVNVAGPWEDVVGAVSPHSASRDDSAKFFRTSN